MAGVLSSQSSAGVVAAAAAAADDDDAAVVAAGVHDHAHTQAAELAHETHHDAPDVARGRHTHTLESMLLLVGLPCGDTVVHSQAMMAPSHAPVLLLMPAHGGDGDVEDDTPSTLAAAVNVAGEAKCAVHGYADLSRCMDRPFS